MFELNQHHREALLERLQKAQEELESKKNCIETQKEKEPESTLIDWWDMDVFLLEKNIELIKKSLIDNEIEF